MAGAVIRLDQARPSGPTPSVGTAGQARNDLWESQLVTCVSTLGGNTTYAWSFADIPPGSTATLSGASTFTATFTPDLPGSYAVTLTVNGGGSGNVQTLVAAVLFNSTGISVGRGWRVPALGEVAAWVNWGGQTRGWDEALRFILADLLAHIGGGGGAPVWTAVRMTNHTAMTVLASWEMALVTSLDASSNNLKTPVAPADLDRIMLVDMYGYFSTGSSFTVTANAGQYIASPDTEGYGANTSVTITTPNICVEWLYDLPNTTWVLVRGVQPLTAILPQAYTAVDMDSTAGPLAIGYWQRMMVDATAGATFLTAPGGNESVWGNGETQIAIVNWKGSFATHSCTVTCSDSDVIEDPANPGTFSTSIVLSIKSMSVEWVFDQIGSYSAWKVL